MAAAIGIFARTVVHATLYVPDTGVATQGGASDSPSIASEVSGFVSGIVHPDTKPAAGAVKPKPKPPAAHPARLLIPSIGVDARVQNLGVTSKGTLGSPSNFTDVGWFADGPVPGAQGTAVFDGHVDNGLGLAGVFKSLSSVKKGDEVTVVTNAGKRLTYTVSDIRSYGYKEVPESAIFSVAGQSQIRLITCEGDWISGDKTYDRRLIVTAVLAE